MTIDRSYANSGCNNSKCYSCNFRFVCASSPYCVIQNNSTQTTKDIEDLKKEVANVVNAQMNIIASIVDKIDSVTTGVASVEKSLYDLKEAIENISSKIEEQEQLQKVFEPMSDSENQIIPFENREEKVMVEKKGFFGKNKWVEQKK